MESREPLQRISQLYQRLEDLKVLTLSDPDRVSKILSDICNELQVVKALLEENHHQKETRVLEQGQLKEVLRQMPAGAIASDATGKMVKEEALWVSEEMNKLLFENAEDGIALYVLTSEGLPGKFSQVNEATCRMLGYSKEELCQLTPMDIMEEGLSDNQEERRKVLSNDKSTNFESTLISKDGSKIPAEIRSTFADLEGNPAALLIIRDITERKRKEEELQDSRDFLYKIINSIADPIFVKDRQQRYLLVNSAECNLVGQAPEKMIGKTSYDFFSKEQADVFWEKNEEVFETGRENTNEEVVTDTKGIIRTVVTKKTLYRDKAGNEFLVGIVRDITDRKLMEYELKWAREDLELRVWERTLELQKANAALRESKDYLDKIINTVGDPIFVKNRQHRIILVNDAACKLFGRSRCDIIGRTAYDLFPTKEMAKISWEKDEEVFRTGKENVNEETNTYSPAVTRTVLVKKTLYTDTSGNKFLVGATRDITDRKKAEEALRESERRLIDIIDFLPDATFVIDREGRVIAWNRAIETMTGVKAKEMLGKGSYEYALPFYGERRPILINLVLNEDKEFESRYNGIEYRGGTLFGEAYMPNMRGGEVYLLASAAVLYDSAGNLFGAIESIRDITDRKKAENELKKAKEAAEAAARSKSEFLANMSHEIRTPLNAVVGLTGLLLSADLTPEQRDFVETVRSSGNTLLSTINDILDFSKIEGGKMELESQPIYLRSCIETSLDLVAAKAAEKSLTLGYFMDDAVPETVIGDVTRLRQVLVNLLSNAVKFTDKGKIDVSATARATNSGQFEIHFAVKDTGIGIPRDKLNRLFHVFSQIDSSTTRKYGGTGLGLAISKRLVEIMGGKIWVESEAGAGSTFHFTIMAKATRSELVDSGVPAASVQSQKMLSSNRSSQLRILLAEDNAVNQKVALHMLKRLGYCAEVAFNGLEVLEALERQPFDVVLMDIQMPEMDGIDAARIIRERWPDGPKIIAITAYALEGDKERCLQAGMDDYISKPIQLEELRSILESCS